MNSENDAFGDNEGFLSCSDVRTTYLGRFVFTCTVLFTVSSCAFLVVDFNDGGGTVGSESRIIKLAWATIDYLLLNALLLGLMTSWWTYTHIKGNELSVEISRRHRSEGLIGLRYIWRLKFFTSRKFKTASKVISALFFAAYPTHLIALALLSANIDQVQVSAYPEIHALVPSSATWETAFAISNSWSCLSTTIIMADFLLALFYHRNFTKRSENKKGQHTLQSKQLDVQSKALAFGVISLLSRSGSTFFSFAFNACPYEPPELNARGDPFKSPYRDVADFFTLSAVIFIMVSDGHPLKRQASRGNLGMSCD